MSPPSSAKPGLELEVRQSAPMLLQGRFGCQPGELLALVGPSGAGKTSMLRVLAGLMRPQAGRVQVGGEVWCDTERALWLPPQARHVGLVFQDYALMPHLTALQNVALALLHLPRRQREQEARRWLQHMKLAEPQLHSRPAQLSGGQQQRVAVARALARQPRLLLMDEPFSAVDLMNRRGLYQLIADLRRELSIPIVLVTHDLQEARQLADRLVVMDAGRVLQSGTPQDIHRAPRNARVAELVGILNRFSGRWLGPADKPGVGRLQWEVEVEDGPVLEVRDKGRLDPGQAVSWVLPGDAVSLATQTSEGAHWWARVQACRHQGEVSLLELRLELPGSPCVELLLAGHSRRGITVGERLPVALDLSQVHVMPVRSGSD
ncbi:MAG: ABC transporter ATP-binding protein [Burkholderiales bacterium]|nr:ABC transporter ATP-binding protein [Burkholderiales bacterium]